MSPYRAALLALVVVGAAFASAAPAGATSGDDVTRDALGGTHDAFGEIGVQADATADDTVVEERANVGDAQETGENDSANDSALGADISSFMQSSMAETDGAVETGMWSAAFNGTENQSVRQRLVERQTNELRARLAELREEKEELMAERETGNVSETAYKARVSRLAGRINALESSINATSSKAREAGTGVEELSNLRTETKNLSGPEVSAVARNVTGVGNGNGAGVGNGNGGQGPPDDVGNGNGPSDAGNGTAGPPNDQSNNSTEAGQRGPPEDAGNAPLVDGETGNETPGRDDAPGHDGVRGQGPKAILSPTDAFDGSIAQAPASVTDASLVSTVRLPTTELLAVGFSA
jgi:hypothetical protein